MRKYIILQKLSEIDLDVQVTEIYELAVTTANFTRLRIFDSYENAEAWKNQNNHKGNIVPLNTDEFPEYQNIKFIPANFQTFIQDFLVGNNFRQLNISNGDENFNAFGFLLEFLTHIWKDDKKTLYDLLTSGAVTMSNRLTNLVEGSQDYFESVLLAEININDIRDRIRNFGDHTKEELKQILIQQNVYFTE